MLPTAHFLAARARRLQLGRPRSLDGLRSIVCCCAWVRLWHVWDIPTGTENVRTWRQTGSDRPKLKTALFEPISGQGDAPSKEADRAPRLQASLKETVSAIDWARAAARK